MAAKGKAAPAQDDDTIPRDLDALARELRRALRKLRQTERCRTASATDRKAKYL